jgi:Phage-related minor tail protein
MSNIKNIGIEVVFKAANAAALSATRSFGDALQGLDRKLLSATQTAKGLFSSTNFAERMGAVFGGATMVLQNAVKPLYQVAETYEAAETDARIAFMNSAGKTSEVFDKIIASSKQYSKDYAGSAKDFMVVATTLRLGGMKEQMILAKGLKAVADLATLEGAKGEEAFAGVARRVGVFSDAFKIPEARFDEFVNRVYKARSAFELETTTFAESLKYAQGAISALGMTGFDGAESTLTVFGMLKQAGIEGSLAGTSFNEFAKRLARADEEIIKLKKKGILSSDFSMSFFKDGKFLGYEKTFEEMEKLKTLSQERLLEALPQLFGEQGGQFASAVISKGGAQGFRDFGRKYAEVADKEIAIGKKQATAQMKRESAEGALENAKAEAGRGFLDITKWYNDFVGDKIAPWLAENPVAAAGLDIGMEAGKFGLMALLGVSAKNKVMSMLGGLSAKTALDGAATASKSLILDQFGKPMMAATETVAANSGGLFARIFGSAVMKGVLRFLGPLGIAYTIGEGFMSLANANQEEAKVAQAQRKESNFQESLRVLGPNFQKYLTPAPTFSPQVTINGANLTQAQLESTVDNLLAKQKQEFQRDLQRKSGY